jgi:serine/threonine-protein kinase
MSASITLTVQNGSLAGKKYFFSEPRTYVIGRADDCDLQLPSGVEFRTISRRHCQLDIDPSEIRLQDLGSTNGTFINGSQIGQSAARKMPEEDSALALRGYDLRDGDELRIGGVTFRVSVSAPATCPKQSARCLRG